MDEQKYLEAFKKIKRMVGEFAVRISEEEKSVTISTIPAVKDTASAWLKLCEICEDGEEGEYGAQRRNRRNGRYMESGYMASGGGQGGGSRGGYGEGGYGYGMPDYGRYGAESKVALATELETLAQSGDGTEAMKTALREAARWLKQA